MIREDLATAATITGLTNVTEYYRQSLRPGDGFVRMGQRRRAANGFGFVQDWEVWLALPADPATAEKWLDDHLTEITEAVSGVIVVTTATPSELILGQDSANGVVLAGSIAA